MAARLRQAEERHVNAAEVVNALIDLEDVPPTSRDTVGRPAAVDHLVPA